MDKASAVRFEGVGQQGEMAQPQHALAPVLPVESEIEFDPRRASAQKRKLFLDRPFGRFDPGEGQHVAIGLVRDLRLAPFQVGELVLARRFEHAVAGVPVGGKRDVVEIAMRQAAQSAACAWSCELQAGKRQAAAAVQRGASALGVSICEIAVG